MGLSNEIRGFLLSPKNVCVWQKQAEVWDGSRRTLGLQRDSKAELVIERRARFWGTHRLYNMLHIIQCIRSRHTSTDTAHLYIHELVYIYNIEAIRCCFSPWLSVKNWKVKQSQNVSFLFHKHMVIAVLLHNWRWGGKRKKPACWQIQRIVSIDPWRLCILHERLVLDAHRTPGLFQSAANTYLTIPCLQRKAS